MKKIFLTLALVLALVNPGLAAWNASKPADNEKLKDTPSLLRDNFAAIATGTDANLCVNNTKMCANASISDDKLAQITSAAKVSGTALTGLSSIPGSGNGQIPIANGGTGQSTAANARNALLPTQTGNSGKSLITDATNASWGYPSGLTIASSAQGDLLYNNGSVWTRLAAGTAGQVLRTEGAGANPSFGYPAGLTIASQAQGDVLYNNGSAWVRLAAGTSGQFLKTLGAGANPLWATAQSSQVFTADGTFTAPTGIYTVYVTMTGGGGGGGGSYGGDSGGGGGSAAYVSHMILPVTPGNSYSVTVGAAGTYGASGAWGGTGGNSTFQNDYGTITVNGGDGGGGPTYGWSAGAAGGASGSDNFVGQAGSGSSGGAAYYDQLTHAGYAGGQGQSGSGNDAAGGGASNPFGKGGVGGICAAQGGRQATDATGHGAGGGGGAQNDYPNGGAGSAGLVVVEW